MLGEAGRGSVRGDGKGRVAVTRPFPSRGLRDSKCRRHNLDDRRHDCASSNALSGRHIVFSAGYWTTGIGLCDGIGQLCAIGCHRDRHCPHLDANHECKDGYPTQEVREWRFAHRPNMDCRPIRRKGSNNNCDKPAAGRDRLSPLRGDDWRDRLVFEGAGMELHLLPRCLIETDAWRIFNYRR